VVRTMYRALEEGDDSIFARCLDPQAEWIHTMVARLPEQPTPIFAELYKLLSWTAGFPFSSYTYPSRRPSSPVLVQKSGLQALHQKAALNQKSPS
jgi:hypothetical protein